MKLLEQIPSWLKNKYFIAFAAFVIWMLFFDTQDLFTQMRHHHELKDLQTSKAYFTSEIDKLNKIRLDITTNPVMIEKIARENYYMKRDNEDLFLIPEPQKN